MPRLDAIPGGCAFHPRCPRAIERCRHELPDARPGRRDARRLLATARSRAGARGWLSALLTLTDVARTFDVSPPWLDRVLERKPRALLKAVDGVSLSIATGETLGLVGESGCGKSTVARLIVGLYAPTRGTIEFDGTVLAGDGARRRARPQRAARRGMQMIFQDPYASLNPRWRVADIIAEPILAQAPEMSEGRRMASRVAALLAQVGLAAADGVEVSAPVLGRPAAADLDRARAVDAAALSRLRRADVRARRLGAGAGAEPDARPAARLGLTYLFISHNLAVVHHIADRVGVMYLGRIVELAPTRRLFARRGIRIRGCCSPPCPISR